MAANLANGIRCSFMGFPVWGSDVGGYFGGKIPENLYARWLQLGTWSALYEIKFDNAAGLGEEGQPWKYSKKLQQILRECNNLRIEMLPFFYSLVNTSYKNVVVMKPLAYVYSHDEKTYHIWDQYILGNTFLVAPILDSTNTRQVYLPEEKWTDHDNNKSYDGSQHITITQPLERIPIFIKNNSLFVSGNFSIGNLKLWYKEKQSQLTIHLFSYQNNGNISFDYIDFFDNNKEKLLIAKSTPEKIEFRAPILKCPSRLVIKLDRKPKEVILNGKKTKYKWDTKQKLTIVYLKQLAENILILKR